MRRDPVGNQNRLPTLGLSVIQDLLEHVSDYKQLIVCLAKQGPSEIHILSLPVEGDISVVEKQRSFRFPNGRKTYRMCTSLNTLS